MLNQHRDKMAVLNAVAFVPEYGMTDTASALDAAGTVMFTPENGDRAGVPNTVIVITGGWGGAGGTWWGGAGRGGAGDAGWGLVGWVW